MIRNLFALVAAPLLMSADLPPGVDPRTINSGYPPARFMGQNVAVVFFVDDINSMCGTPPPGYQFEACASGTENKIALQNPCSARFEGEYYAKIACHELAHINGWPATHGD